MRHTETQQLLIEIMDEANRDENIGADKNTLSLMQAMFTNKMLAIIADRLADITDELKRRK